MKKYKISVCKTKTCSERFSRDTKKEFERLVKKHDMEHAICVADGGCYGRCDFGPNVFLQGPVEDEQLWKELCAEPSGPHDKRVPGFVYRGVYPFQAKSIFESHCLHNTPLEDLLEQQKEGTVLPL